jgi:hypothetical protein
MWWGWRWEAESVVIIEDNTGQIGGGGYGSSGNCDRYGKQGFIF